VAGGSLPRPQKHYVKLSGRLAAGNPGSIWANQFDNLAKPAAPTYRTHRSAEIWEQTGRIGDAWCRQTGTAGHLAGGGALFLKERSPARALVLADPHAAPSTAGQRLAKLKAEGSSITEGICKQPQSRQT